MIHILANSFFELSNVLSLVRVLIKYEFQGFCKVSQEEEEEEEEEEQQQLTNF